MEKAPFFDLHLSNKTTFLWELQILSILSSVTIEIIRMCLCHFNVLCSPRRVHWWKLIFIWFQRQGKFRQCWSCLHDPEIKVNYNICFLSSKLSFWTLTKRNIVTIVSECIEITNTSFFLFFDSTNTSLSVCLVWKKESVSFVYGPNWLVWKTHLKSNQNTNLGFLFIYLDTFKRLMRPWLTQLKTKMVVYSFFNNYKND
jgi:hypothetical protein